MKKFLLSLVSLLMLTLFAQAGAPYKLLTFPDYNDKSIGSYTAEWTATVDGDVWTLNGFNNNSNKWESVKCGRKDYEQTATITSPAVDKAITHVLVSVLATKNVTSATLTVLNGAEVVGEPKDITESFITGEVVTEVAGAAGYSYKLTVNSKAGANGSTEIGKVALYEEGQYVDEATHIANDAESAYTVARAIELIEAGESLSETVYVKGIVSQVDNYSDKYKSITYWISDDGTTTNQFECYSGKGIGGADFASIDDVKVGASVIVKGTMKKYTPKEGDPIYEFNQNNELVSYAEPVYIQNADFASLEGWTAVTSSQYKDLGNGLIGEYNVRISPATVDETHLATEYCLGFECRWNTNFASYTQTVTTLPAGSYSLVYDVENVNAATTAADYENRFTVTVGETVYSDSFTEWMKGKSAWTTHAIVFTVEEGQQVTISLGYGTGSNNFSADNTPAIYVSHLKLAGAATGEALILAKAKEEKLAVLDAFVAGEGLFQYSQRAIEVAKRAVNAANTVEEVEAVDMPTPTLPDAEKQYTLQQKASGLYMSLSDGVKLAAKAYPLSWVATEGGWYIKNENLYVGLAGSDNWTMSTDADKKLVITPAAIDIEGVVYYTLSEVKGMIASDGTEAGSACYTDKSVAKSGDKAYWAIAEYVAPVAYTVTISEEIVNGTVEATPTEAEAGETITLTITPAEGYELDQLEVLGANGAVVVVTDNTFTMPAANVRVFATFKEAASNDYTSYIKNADLSDASSTAWDTEGTKGYHKDVSGVVTAANNAVYDFKQTIEGLPAGKYKVSVQAAYRYGGDEQTEADAYFNDAIETKFAKLYATVGKKTVDVLVKNRYDGATDTDWADGNGSVVVEGKPVPNSTAAVKAWFDAKQYTNDLEFNLAEAGDVTIGIVKTAQPEAGDYTVIGPWTLTRLGDAEEEPVYTVNISDAIENGTIEATPTTAQAGATVSLSATPAEGYVLASIMVTCKTIDKVVIVSEEHVFTMPDDDVTVTATFAPAPTVWEAYPGWTRDNMASARYFGIKTPGTAADAYAISAFQIAQESGYGASTSYAVIATDVPEGTALDASKVVAVSTDAVTPDVAAPGKFFDYALTEEVVLKGATVYYVAFTTSNEPVDGSFTVQGQRVSLNVSYGTYPYPYVDGGGTARTTWTPGFKAELTLPTFAINCAEVENGKVETNVAEAKVGDKVIVTATPAEGYKLKAIMVTGKTSDIAVEVAEDGSFIMPADDVTVSATFKDLASVVYIETDLTAQFSSLTDWTKWVGATGYTATNFCPAVTTNAGQNVQVCEKYVTNCTETGEIFYQTLTGLAEGTYKIELFGGAAYTFGRGFDSEAFSGGTWNAGDKITENTGVKLYAVTSEGEFGGEIPIYYATNFPDGAAVVTLNDVKVGSNGELKIGMSKTSKSTNWHVIQLKGVTATVDAAALLANNVKEAEAIDPATIPAALATQINETVVANDKDFETADEYKAAIAAIEAVVAKAVAYAPLTEVLAQGEIYKAHVAEGNPAIAAYEQTVADVAAAYAAVSVADIPAAIAVVEAALPALAKAQTADGSDLTVFIVNADISNHAEGWTIERPNGGGGPELPAGGSLEYWAGSANPRSEASFDYYQVIEGLPAGLYTLSADLFNSTNSEDGAVFAPTSGVYASADNEEATLVDVDGTEPITYTTDVVLVSDGKLRIGVKNTEKPMAARWFVADNFKLTLVKALSETELAYEQAIASIEDSASYRVFTTVNEKKFYLNNTGYLVADVNKAASFTFAMVNASGTLYETGINLGCKFTNPKLTSGATGDVVKQGHIIVGSYDRDNWERQVFFLKDGKYAVRATNANSEEWGANTYWTVDNIEAELPNAEYALNPAYVWEIEKYVDNRPAAYAKAQTWAAKLQAIEGLVTDAANWTTNAQESTEGNIKNICDGDVSTFFHSQWSGTGPNADHYIQATLPEAAQKFHIAFYKRNDSNRPTSIVVSAGDAEPAQTITEGLPAPAWYSAEVDLGTAADVVRFTVPTTSTGGANNGHVYFTFGEFYILPSNELTDAACKYIVSDYTDIDPDFDPAEIERIDEQIEIAYQQAMLKEELADLAACIARGKEFIAAYPVEDAEQLAQEATGTLDRLAEGEYTSMEEIAVAKTTAILTVQHFIGATGTPTVDADITEWFVKNPTPIAHQAVAEGWEGDKFGDASDGVSEYWNKAAATFHQTITLPAGDYKLTVVALQRTNMAGVVYAGDAQKTIAQATTDEANSRGQAATWFNAGNGVNEVKFTMAEAGEIEIGLITDNTTGDHWTVWQSFKIEKLAPVPPVAFTVTPNIASGTQAEFTTVEAGSALKLTVSTENLEANGYDPKDISLKVGTIFASRWSDKGFAMGTNERPPYMKNDIVLPLADEVTLADDVFGTEYPFIQSIRITDLSLVKGEEPIAAINEMIVISFIEVYENGKPVGIKAIATEGEKADIYDLSGRKVEKVQRGGIYIINGKKVSMK